ncbi:UNVERIFIED_CONTAM: hypothetical protein HDU68_009604 [Siphonaria sp. JEL0065]|nr:hypothetical protein HDU68_009604 [Siphonaria sp. JEL0065]
MEGNTQNQKQHSAGGPIRGARGRGRGGWTPRPPRAEAVKRESISDLRSMRLDDVNTAQADLGAPLPAAAVAPGMVVTKIKKHKKTNKANPDNIQVDAVEIPDQEDIDAVIESGGGESLVHLSSTRFQDLVSQGVICGPVGRALKEVIGHEFLTQVQDKTMLEILNGHDCLAQAKTGTGKTLGFLIPSIERVYREAYATNPPTLPHPNAVSILVISPTRELAQQITVEAEQLLRFLPLGVQCVIGGTNMQSEARKLNAFDKRVDVLVGTPGRLKDHLENSNLKQNCAHLQVIIFDEADRLLDEGFKQDIDKIIALLPKAVSANRSIPPRQTLLFSATIPPSVHAVAKQALLPNFKFITTIAEYESNTHEHVPQHHLVVPMEDMLTASFGVLNQILADKNIANPKIIMFFPTARTTQLFAELLLALKIKCPVFEIHSRKSQSARTKATDAFRISVKGIMVSSDVSARGMDFPGVTHVLQVGVPANREQYIHRLGRTARAGSSGTGLLLLGAFEAKFLTRQLRDLPLKPYPYPNPITPALTTQVQTALQFVPLETKEMAYQAWLGFYNTWIREFGWKGKEELVDFANRYAIDCLGCANVPGLLRKTVGKMGLKGIAGLVIVEENGGGGRGGGGGGRGGQQQQGGSGAPEGVGAPAVATGSDGFFGRAGFNSDRGGQGGGRGGATRGRGGAGRGGDAGRGQLGARGGARGRGGAAQRDFMDTA